MNKAVGAILAIAGLGVGFGAGYFTAKKVLERQFLAQLDEEIEAYRTDFPHEPRTVNIYSSPAEAVEALIPEDEQKELEKIIQNEGYTDSEPDDGVVAPTNFFAQKEKEFEAERQAIMQRVMKPEEEDGLVHTNLWDVPQVTEAEALSPDVSEEEEDDTVEEVASEVEETPELVQEPAENMPERDLERPYVITYEEFADDEIHPDPMSLIYFEEDDILSDDNNKVIDDIDNVISIGNLSLFGLGSHDKNIVYVRNHKLESDYEVVRDRRSYMEVVYGVRPDRNGPRRMRDDDD